MAKYTLELGQEFEKQLNEVSRTKSLSKAEVIRRAVATYVVINREASQGHRISVTNEKNQIVKEIVSV